MFDNKKGQEGWGIFTIVFLAILLILGVTSCESVPAGSVGVKDTFGSVDDKELEPGVYWLNPFTSVVDMSVQVQKVTYESVVGISKDSQEITTEVTVNYRLEPSKASDMYKNIGARRYIETIGQPIIIGIIKSELAKYPATEYAANWEKLKALISSEITAKLSEHGIIVTEVSITDFDFTAKFNEAIDSKSAAEQKALEAENKARQTVTEAQALADALRLRADAQAYETKTIKDAEAYGLRVVREQLEESPKLVEYTIAQRWDGALPRVSTTDSGMLIALPDNTVQ